LTYTAEKRPLRGYFIERNPSLAMNQTLWCFVSLFFSFHTWVLDFANVVSFRHSSSYRASSIIRPTW